MTVDLSQSKMVIAGTSSLHDWQSKVENFKIQATKTEDGFNGLSGSIEIKSIKSGKSIMDDKTYNALNEKQYPNITFSGETITINNNEVTGSLLLTINGQTQTIEMSAMAKQEGNGWSISGSVPVDMQNYNIEPPTAMFGTLTTGKDIIISYQIKFNK